MFKALLTLIILTVFPSVSFGDNYNADDLRSFAEEQESKAAALEEKVKYLNAEIDQLNAVTKRQRAVLDQWDSCELCVSICKEKIKDQICHVE